MRNRFGKLKYHYKDANAQILATKSEVFQLTDAALDNYGPFVRLWVFNNSATCTILISLNAAVLGDDTVQTTTHAPMPLQPESALEIVAEDGVTFTHVCITNTHAATTIAANEIRMRFQNY